MKEQKCIGQFFEKVDKLITLHQRKLEQLEQLKNTLLSKMFPKSGTNIPEIRFSGFTDAWKQRKLSQILLERNHQSIQTDEYPLVSFTVENGVTPKTERYDREQLVTGDKDKKKYKITKYDDIVYNPANLKFGAISRNKYGNAVFSPIYVTFEVNKNDYLPSFIEYYVIRWDFINYALRFQQGTVYERQSVNVADFLKLRFYSPDKTYQGKLSSLFIIIDDYIAIHQRKLEQLKNLKQTLLNKMFV